MMPPDVYPEGIPFPDARPPQDNGDRLYDDAYLMSISGGIADTNGVLPVYPNGQPTPIGGLSPRFFVENPIPSDDDALMDDNGADVLDSQKMEIDADAVTQVAGAPPLPSYPGQTAFNPAAVIADDITFRTGRVYAPTVSGPSPGPVPDFEG